MERPSRLDAEAIAAVVAEHPQWIVVDGSLRRSFAFDGFAQAFAFMTELALVAERLDHHPEWSNIYNRVEIAMTTHDAGGITQLDVEFIRYADAAAARFVGA